jgi:Uma2 family endonuclease
VEVLSPTTEAYDRGKKFARYRRNPNLIDYVLVSSEEMAIDIYHKNQAGDWLILSYRAGDTVEFQSINLRVPIEQIYEEIIFEESPGGA